ncbi:MAG: NADH-quinone oxidoreductase subunit K [Phycisphaerales bacterium]
MFLCTELMFQAAGIALVAFKWYHLNFDGQTFVIFVLCVAAAEWRWGWPRRCCSSASVSRSAAEAWQELKG